MLTILFLAGLGAATPYAASGASALPSVDLYAYHNASCIVDTRSAYTFGGSDHFCFSFEKGGPFPSVGLRSQPAATGETRDDCSVSFYIGFQCEDQTRKVSYSLNPSGRLACAGDEMEGGVGSASIECPGNTPPTPGRV